MDRGLNLDSLRIKNGSDFSMAKFIATMIICYYFRNLESKGIDILDNALEMVHNKKLKKDEIRPVNKNLLKMCIDTAAELTHLSGKSETQLGEFVKNIVFPAIVDHYNINVKIQNRGIRSLDEVEMERKMRNAVDMLLDPGSSPFYVTINDDVRGILDESFHGDVPERCEFFRFHETARSLLERGVLSVPFANLCAKLADKNILKISFLDKEPNDGSYVSQMAMLHSISLGVLMSAGRIYESQGAWYFTVDVSMDSLCDLIVREKNLMPVQRDVIVFGDGLEGLPSLHDIIGEDRIGNFARIVRTDVCEMLFINVIGTCSANVSTVLLARYRRMREDENKDFVILFTDDFPDELLDDISRVLDRKVYVIPADPERAERIRLYNRDGFTDAEDLTMAMEMAMWTNSEDAKHWTVRTDRILYRRIMDLLELPDREETPRPDRRR